MTKVHVTEQDKALISALLDGENPVSEETITKLDETTLGRYSLIGDIMRGETAPVLQLDIADKVAAQLESEPVHAEFGANPQLSDKEPAEKGKVISLNWLRPVAQLAIAASVAVVAVVGVQTLPQGTDAPSQPLESEIPMLQSTPFAGVASPVSYSSEPALENAGRGLRELQQQRIGALVLEHHRQTRMASTLTEETDAKSADQEEQK